MPNYPTLVAGTACTWLNTGGDKVLTLTSLANAAAREGDKKDFYDATYGLPELLECRLETAVGSAATNGLAVELWLGESDSATAGTANPGNLTGADAGLTTPDEYKLQCTFAGALALSNARSTSVQVQRFSVPTTCRAVVPLIVNKSGQTLSGTAADHKLVITPYYRVIN